MLNLPPRIIAFLAIRVAPAQSAAQTGKIFCARCDQLATGSPEERRLHAFATHNSHDGRVFLGYQVGHWIFVRMSRGRDRSKWFATCDGGIFCENGHYTGIKHGQLFHVADTRQHDCDGAAIQTRFHCQCEALTSAPNA